MLASTVSDFYFLVMFLLAGYWMRRMIVALGRNIKDHPKETIQGARIAAELLKRFL
jgi:hypothetical protein